MSVLQHNDADPQGILTVVIIGLNSARTLAACVRSVRQACRPRGKVPVIYVDGGSRDGSAELAAELGVDVIQLAHEYPTAGKGRNAGWKAARTQFVQFVDSDTLLDPEWLAKGLEAIAASEQIAAVFGRLFEINPDGSIYNRVCNFDWHVPPGDRRYCGGNALFRRNALWRENGFGEDLVVGEEPELCRRLRARGFRIVCIDAVTGRHDLNMMRFAQYWRRGVRSGYAYADIGLRFVLTDDKLWFRELARSAFTVPITAAAAAALTALLGLPGLLLAAAAVVGAVARKCVALKERRIGFQDRLLYALHSYFVKIPLFVGVVRWLAGRLLNRRLRNRRPGGTSAAASAGGSATPLISQKGGTGEAGLRGA